MPQRVVFAYEHRYRVLDVDRVWQSKAGDHLLSGYDPDKGEYRTFRFDRIKGKIRYVPQPRGSQADPEAE